MKITFRSREHCFARNVLRLYVYRSLTNAELALYDIDEERLDESYAMLSVINKNINNEEQLSRSI